jgi:hypothetical protein
MRNLPPCCMQNTEAGLAMPTLGGAPAGAGEGAGGWLQALTSKAVAANVVLFFMGVWAVGCAQHKSKADTSACQRALSACQHEDLLTPRP